MLLDWPIANELDGCDGWCGRIGCLECFIYAERDEADYLVFTGTALTINEIAKAAIQNDIFAESVL